MSPKHPNQQQLQLIKNRLVIIAYLTVLSSFCATFSRDLLSFLTRWREKQVLAGAQEGESRLEPLRIPHRVKRSLLKRELLPNQPPLAFLTRFCVKIVLCVCTPCCSIMALPYHITSNSLMYDHKKQQTAYRGEVHLTQGKTMLTADQLIIFLFTG